MLGRVKQSSVSSLQPCGSNGCIAPLRLSIYRPYDQGNQLEPASSDGSLAFRPRRAYPSGTPGSLANAGGDPSDRRHGRRSRRPLSAQPLARTGPRPRRMEPCAVSWLRGGAAIVVRHDVRPHLPGIGFRGVRGRERAPSHGQVLNRRQLRRLAEALPPRAAVVGDYNLVGPALLPGFRRRGSARAHARGRRLGTASD